MHCGSQRTKGQNVPRWVIWKFRINARVRVGFSGDTTRIMPTSTTTEIRLYSMSQVFGPT